MLDFIRRKLIQIGIGLVLGGCLFLYLELSKGKAPDIASLKTYQGTLAAVPMTVHDVKGIKLKSYDIEIETEDEGLVKLQPDMGFVTTEKLAPFIGKPAVAKASSTKHIWLLSLDGQEIITYEQVKKRYEREPSLTLPLGGIGIGLLLFLGGYFIPRSRF